MSDAFDSLSRIHEGSTTSLEILTDGLGAQFEIEEQPFLDIDYDRSGIELHFATREGQEELVHRIPHAKQVQIEERDDGLIAALQIASDDDPVAVLRFQSPKSWKFLPTASE